MYFKDFSEFVKDFKEEAVKDISLNLYRDHFCIVKHFPVRCLNEFPLVTGSVSEKRVEQFKF